MERTIGHEIATLQRMTVKELRTRYAEVFGEETNGNNRAWLLKRIAWRVQALAEGDLSDRARQRATELARDADLRLSPPKVNPSPAPQEMTPTRTVRFPQDDRLPPPGTVITRKYKGEVLQVKVLSEGFEHEGQTYGSLSAAARAITGAHCNGYLFFRLGGTGGNR